jgi:hypothetical protein
MMGKITLKAGGANGIFGKQWSIGVLECRQYNAPIFPYSNTPFSATFPL